MIVALTYVGGSFITLVLLTVVYAIEDVKGRRIFLASLREKIDALLISLSLQISSWFFSFGHGFMRLLFHYGAHSILKRVLATLQGLEFKVEDLVRKNRKIARDIRDRKRSHLTDIATHKETVSLTSEQKVELKSR